MGGGMRTRNKLDPMVNCVKAYKAVIEENGWSVVFDIVSFR